MNLKKDEEESPEKEVTPSVEEKKYPVVQYGEDGLCDGFHGAEDIAGALADEYDQSFNDVLDHTATFIKQM